MESWLSWFMKGLIILSFLILISRVFEVQIIKGEYYRSLSEEQRIKHIPILAPRGKILARGGEELVGPDFAHITGYLAKVNDSEIGKVNPDCPERGVRGSEMLVGRTGLQEQYQCILQGTDGEELIEVNTKGEKLRTLAVKKPIPGQNLHTTIDFNLQKEAAKDMDQRPGALIFTDKDGEILAFYSSPSFDPADLTMYVKNKNLPLFNRVIAGVYHPGSVFKPIVALSALEGGQIDKNFQYTDTGKIDVNGFSYKNWYFTEYGGVEGSINVVRALIRSTDTFFYKIGEMAGPDEIAKYADDFGLNQKTGIDIPGEVFGLIPTPEWKKTTKKESWFLGNTYHMAIGQGDVGLTPIEINTYISAIANDGKICTPHFNIDESPKCRKIKVNENNLQIIKEGMKGACTSGGTGYTFFDFEKTYSKDLACKTGTAQVGIDSDPHSWFTLFSPVDSPQIIGTVLIENGGEGSKVAGPVARKVMDKWELIQNP